MTAKRYVIALSYDYNSWIIHRFCTHIKRLAKDRYDVILFSVHDMHKRPDFYKELFLHVDIILNMLPSCLLDIKKLTSKPIINTVHHYVDKDFIRPFVLQADYIITVSDEWKNRIIADFDYPVTKITTIHCGVEQRLLTTHRPLIKKQQNVKNIGFFAKYTSNEQDRKGIRHFKKLINYMNKNQLLTMYRFIISGAGWEHFVDKARKKGANIVYTPFVKDKDMPRLYASLDFYLVLSDIEGGPATVLESMASKVPCLANNIGLIKDICKDDYNIILINPKHAAQICQKLQHYTMNQEARDKIIHNGYNTAKNMLYDKIFCKYIEILDKMCANMPKPRLSGRLNLEKLNAYLQTCAPKPY